MGPLLPIKLCSILLFSFFSARAFGAACCGGSLAAPAMIAGDDRAQVSAVYSHARITDDVYSDGTWHSRQSPEFTETWTLEGAHVFADRWQAGASVPLVKREKNERSSTGLGDVAGTVGYEYLPDWDYNPARPKGVGFVQVTAPTGTSIHEANDPMEARGRGFWALGAGTVLSKSWGRWDAMTLLSVRRSFPKNYLTPGWGGVLSAGGGYNWRSLRAGGGLLWNYEDPVRAGGRFNTQGSAQRFASGMISLSYSLSKSWLGTVSYLDQTWFGSPVNANLQRSVQMQIQYKVAR